MIKINGKECCMKISDMIKLLQLFKKINGDLDIIIKDDCTDEVYSINDLKVRTLDSINTDFYFENIKSNKKVLIISYD